MTYRPVPGKFTFDLVHNAIVEVRGYKTDANGETVLVATAGSYRATIPLPLSCIRRLTDDERFELSSMHDAGMYPQRR